MDGSACSESILPKAKHSRFGYGAGTYEEYEHKKVFKTGLSTCKTFQMPEDREVQA